MASGDSSFDDLCYNLRWLDSSGVEQIKPFHAIEAFPLSHPKVQSTPSSSVAGDPYCGQLPPYSRIPAVSQWRWRSDQRNELQAAAGVPPPCRNMSGAIVFYGYHSPRRYSANVGRYVGGGTSVYMIVDESSQAFMLIPSDEP